MNPYNLIPKAVDREILSVSFFMDNEDTLVKLSKFLAFVFLILAVSY